MIRVSLCAGALVCLMASLPGCESQGGIPFEPYSTGADVAARGAPMGGQVGNDDDDAPPGAM